MKAATRNTYGTPDIITISDIPAPAHGENEILVKVHAATVNRTDCATLSGKPYIMRLLIGIYKPKPITGTDFAGEVEAVGNKVTAFKKGDRIFGFDDNILSSHAEYLTVSEKKGIVNIPQDISYIDAAASAEGVHYAYNFINKVKLKKGDKVLVNGASGAIGSALVQLLKYYGAHVTATTNTKNIELIRSIGADKVIDYLKEDFTRTDELFDYVFDAVGKSTLGKCKKILKPGGTYISSELGPWIQNPFLALITPFIGRRKVGFPFPYDVKRSLNFIKELLEQGKYKPVIDRKYPLNEISEAFRYVETGQKTGNVIITIRD